MWYPRLDSGTQKNINGKNLNNVCSLVNTILQILLS